MNDPANSLNILRGQAMNLYSGNQFVELIPVCRQILEQESGDHLARHLLAIGLEKTNQPDEAAEHYCAAADADPTNINYVQAALNSQIRLDDPSGIIKYGNQYVKLQPQAAPVWTRIGAACTVLGKVRDAIGYYKQALSLDANDLGALNNLGNAFQELGKRRAAATMYRRAIAQKPDLSPAWYNLHAVEFEQNNPQPAIDALQQAAAAAPDNMEIRGYLAMLLDLAGRSSDSSAMFAEVRQANAYYCFLEETWEYIRAHRQASTRLFATTFDSLRYAFSQARNPGLILEFGVRQATSTNFIAKQTRDAVHGFDSFEGLPEQWKGGPSGLYTTFGELPPVLSNVTLHKGWFEDNLPPFCEANDGPVRFLNIDCDTYGSTVTIFDNLGERIGPGCVIIFDEYTSNPGWQGDEYKAFQEFVSAAGHEYDYLLFSPFSKQAAVLIR